MTIGVLASSSFPSSSSTSSILSGFALNSSPITKATTTRYKVYQQQQHSLSPTGRQRGGGHASSSKLLLLEMIKKGGGSSYEEPLSPWDKFKDNIYNAMDSLTLAVSQLQSQPHVVGGGSPIRHETSTIATNSATTCTGEEHNFFTKKNTLEKAHNPFKTAINPDPAHSDIIISTSRSVVPSSSEEYIAATRHVENTVQDTLSTVESLDKEMKRVVLDIQNIPNNVRSFVGHVEYTWEETHKSVKQLVLDVQSIPDNINSFQHNVRHKVEESQRHGRKFVQRIQSIPVEIETVGQWIENAMGSIEKHLIPSSEYHTMKDTKMHFHHPLAPSPSVQVGAAVNQDEDCNQEKMKMNPQPRSSYRTGTVPRTIADIDPNLDNEVTEALRIANDALASKEDLGSKERAN